MSQRRSTVGRRVHHDVAALGSAAVAVGLVAVLVTLPVVVGVGAGFLSEAETAQGALSLATTALEEPLLGGYSTAWLFHAAVIGLLGGTWILGAGLVLDGLFE